MTNTTTEETEAEKLARITAQAEATFGKIAPKMQDAIARHLTALHKPWPKLTQTQQEILLESIGLTVRSYLRQAIDVLIAVDHPKLDAKLVSFTTKGDEIKVVLETSKTTENLLCLGRIGDGPLSVVFTEMRALDDASTTPMVVPQPDQPDLEDDLLKRRGGNGAHPPHYHDNEDLAQAGQA